MSLETSSHFPEHTFRLTVSFALLSRSWSSLHNQILEKLDRTEKQLEVIKSENRQLMDMVKQLLHRAPKRRKVLVQFLINNNTLLWRTAKDDGVYVPEEWAVLLSVCRVHWNKTLERFREGAVLPFPCSANLSVVFLVNLQLLTFRSVLSFFFFEHFTFASSFLWCPSLL